MIRSVAAASMSRPIFGPPRAWRQDDFVASDDRVRGGSSQSYLTPSATLATARFHGVLDTSTLGGAGFASQRTSTTTTTWDLSDYNGIELDIVRGDEKKYTLNVKNVLPEKMENGRDSSTVEYAFNFIAPTQASKIYAPWSEFQAIFRGKEAKDAPPLDSGKILRWSIMMRSFFEEQSGPFSLTLASIKARKRGSRSIDEKGETAGTEDWDLCQDETSRSEKFPSLPAAGQNRMPGMKFCSIL